MSGSRVLVSLRVAAPPERTFSAFTAEIGRWWRPNQLFRFTDRADTTMAFEPGPPGPPERLVEIGTDGERFFIGAVHVWEPPERLAFGWRQAGFTAEQSTEVSVRFEPVEHGTRVTVEHRGWDTIGQTHVARHGFPLGVFQQRVGSWWQTLLRSLADDARR